MIIRLYTVCHHSFCSGMTFMLQIYQGAIQNYVHPQDNAKRNIHYKKNGKRMLTKKHKKKCSTKNIKKSSTRYVYKNREKNVRYMVCPQKRMHQEKSCQSVSQSVSQAYIHHASTLWPISYPFATEIVFIWVDYRRHLAIHIIIFHIFNKYKYFFVIFSWKLRQ